MTDNKEALGFIADANESMEGFEGINNQTMATPFIKLAQDLSPQTKKTKDQFIKGLETGQFFNDSTNEILSTTFDFIVISFERHYICWKPDRAGMVGYMTVAEATAACVDTTAFGKWKDRDGNDLIEYYTYFGLIAGKETEGMVIVSLTSSSIKYAKELNRALTTHVNPQSKKRALPFHLVFTVSSKLKTDGVNDWYVWNFQFKDFITAVQYAVVKEERLALPDNKKKVDYAQITDAGKTNEMKTVSDGTLEDDEL